MSRRIFRAGAFTIIEILVVVTIIGMLLGLSLPAIGGALGAAKKAKVASMAQQVRTAIAHFQTEYGYFPTNGMSSEGQGNTGPQLTLALIGSASATNENTRRIAFLEVPNDFTENGLGTDAALASRGIVTPRGFYKSGQSNLSVAVDVNYDGEVLVNNLPLKTTVAVWFQDPKSTNLIGTWK